MVELKPVRYRMQGIATGTDNKATVQVVMWCKLQALLALNEEPSPCPSGSPKEAELLWLLRELSNCGTL